MKKQILQLVKQTALFSFFLGISLIVFNNISLAQTASEFIRQIGETTELPSFETAGHAKSSPEPGASGITSVVFIVIDLLKYIIGTITVLYAIIAGVKMVTAGKNIEDITTKQKENFKYLVIGLLVVILADTLVTRLFFGQEGEKLASPADIEMAAEATSQEIIGLINIAEMFVGAFAVLMIVINGIRLILNFGNEETMNKVKKGMAWAAGGIVLITLSELIVKDILFKEAGAALPETGKITVLIVEITTFMSAIIGLVAVPILVYGGYLYVASGVNEELKNKAKKVFIGAIIGILIALGAYAIVNTVIDIDEVLVEDQITIEDIQ